MAVRLSVIEPDRHVLLRLQHDRPRLGFDQGQQTEYPGARGQYARSP